MTACPALALNQIHHWLAHQTFRGRCNQYMTRAYISVAYLYVQIPTLRTGWRVEHLMNMDVKGKWRAHEVDTSLRKMQTTCTSKSGLL